MPSQIRCTRPSRFHRSDHDREKREQLCDSTMEVFFDLFLTAVSVVEHDDKQQSFLEHQGFIMVMLIMIVKIRMICLIS